MPFSSLDDLFSYIESFTNLEKSGSVFNERNYRLDRMQILLDKFNNPQNSFKTIHLAGTKGKGSTAALTASALNEAGFLTGLYTSPHVEHYIERITVLSIMSDEGAFLRIGSRIKKVVDDFKGSFFPAQGMPTTFELLTLLAFCYFHEKNCSYGVIETGIGGRLDATNVVNPELCLITPIELEHTDVLGSTLESIAREKGGIIKPGVPVFCGMQTGPVKKTLQKIADEQKSPIYFLDESLLSLTSNCSLKGTEMEMRLKGEKTRRFNLSMIGAFQAENAALACFALYRQLKLPECAFANGFRLPLLPARSELISVDPPVMLDGAHTPLSVQRVLTTFKELFKSGGVLLFGSVSGKNIRGMAEILAPAFNRVIITTPGVFKESSPENIYHIFNSLNSHTELIENTEKAFQSALFKLRKNEALLITGSFYLAAEIKKLLPC